MNTRALFKLGYGLYVVGSQKGGKLNCQIANTVFQITSKPPTIAVSINVKSLSYEFISESKVFTVSILSQDTPLNFIGRLGFKSGREIDKLKDINYKLGKTNAPIVLDHTLAYLEAKVVDDVDVKNHTIFIGELVEADILKEGEPMTYAYYHQVKRGTAPKTAPVYFEEEKEAAPKMAKYRCSVCGYIYYPEEGDFDGGIKPGTPFEEIPDDWTCPMCGAAKSNFRRIEL